jgi:hypothetical protein
MSNFRAAAVHCASTTRHSSLTVSSS